MLTVGTKYWNVWVLRSNDDGTDVYKQLIVRDAPTALAVLRKVRREFRKMGIPYLDMAVEIDPRTDI